MTHPHVGGLLLKGCGDHVVDGEEAKVACGAPPV